MGHRESVEALARHAVEKGDAEDRNQERRAPHEAGARHERLRQRLNGGAFVRRAPAAKAALRHRQRDEAAEDDEESAAGQDRQVQLHRGDRDADRDRYDQHDLLQLHAAQIDGRRVLDADLVRDPGLPRPAQERIAAAPDHRRQQDRLELGDGADHEPGADEEEADDDRKAPAERVRDDARRHLAEEYRRLQRRPDEDDLQRVEARFLRLKDEADADYDREEESVATRERQVDGNRLESSRRAKIMRLRRLPEPQG